MRKFPDFTEREVALLNKWDAQNQLQVDDAFELSVLENARQALQLPSESSPIQQGHIVSQEAKSTLAVVRPHDANQPVNARGLAAQQRPIVPVLSVHQGSLAVEASPYARFVAAGSELRSASQSQASDAGHAAPLSLAMASGRAVGIQEYSQPAIAHLQNERSKGGDIYAVDDRSRATPTRAWIARLHEDLVGQPPDSKVLARWTTAARRGASHREIASGMLVSNAYCRTQIARLYRTLLDRDADAAGLEAWTAQLASGVALQEVIGGFCDGFEYKTNHPEGPAFVESLFERLLGRASDPDGKATWVGALQHRSTLAVIRGFLSCPEYCAQRASEIHERLLGREPTPAELASSTVALMQGAPLQQIVLGFATSPGYIACLRDGAPVPAASRGADPDAKVLALVGRGDIQSALAQLMQRHGTAVYRYCCAAVGDSVLADDIHQQVFIEAYRDLPSFASRSTIRTWLLGIARHRVLDAVKHRKRAQSRVGQPIAAELPDPAADPGDSLDDAQLLAALRVCIAELDEPIRAAVLMRYQQRLTYEEMAAVFDEKPGTLQARVERALRRLRQLIEAHVGGR